MNFAVNVPVVDPARQPFLGRVTSIVRSMPLTAIGGVVVIVLYLAVAVFAPAIAPYGEIEVVSNQSYAPWSAEFLLGTDQIGRDIFSRLVYGARNTIGIAFAATALSFLIGSALGMVAAILRGWVDQILGRIVDATMAIPSLIFALLFLTILGSSVSTLIFVIAILESTRVFRVARSVALDVSVTDFVEEARLRGERLPWIVRREILPNILPALLTEFGLRFCFVFLTISSLSFLGLGIQPPTADWGSMVRENAALITYDDITPLIPAAAIALLTVSVNFVVDWLLYRTSGLHNEN